MKNKRIKLSAIFFLSITIVHSQEAPTASGGDIFGNTGSVNYSVGQVFLMTNIEKNGIESQGVQQPFEILVETSIEKMEGIDLICSVYPSPTSDLLILKIENYETLDLTYRFYDVSGKLIENQKVVEKETKIVTSNFIAATYILKVLKGEQVAKTFRIIKN